MSDEVNNSGTPTSNEGTNQPDDRIKNLSAEFSRKTSNLEDKLSQINQQLQQLSLLGNQVQQPKGDERPDPILDPNGYEAYMERKMEAKMNARLDNQARQQAELGSLAAMYPELSDANSDLTKQALQIYNSMSPQDKTHPMAYKTAIQSAALDIGLLPKHKRQTNKQAQNESDDIGSSSSSNPQRQSNGKKNAKLDPATIAFAQALGKDTNDPEYIKRLEKAAGRSTWSKYKSNKEY